jgi:hypothetical protein
MTGLAESRRAALECVSAKADDLLSAAPPMLLDLAIFMPHRAADIRSNKRDHLSRLISLRSSCRQAAK